MRATGMRFVERLKLKVQKENLWFFILLLLSTEERYGFELRALINEKFGFWSGSVTAYRVLYDLEGSGMVRAEAKDRRKYYQITELGRQEVKEAKAFLQTLLTEQKTG
ncbi:MAG: PadR family transcriptional regulator [Nitrososphaerota archaeon]|nr:PadR family transcriptional regulator [Nitrososphaerota archaeon]MDG7032086.1 PadR family transcriptional regulator [Nitrososphaerota archaeon]